MTETGWYLFQGLSLASPSPYLTEILKEQRITRLHFLIDVVSFVDIDQQLMVRSLSDISSIMHPSPCLSFETIL